MKTLRNIIILIISIIGIYSCEENCCDDYKVNPIAEKNDSLISLSKDSINQLLNIYYAYYGKNKFDSVTKDKVTINQDSMHRLLEVYQQFYGIKNTVIISLIDAYNWVENFSKIPISNINNVEISIEQLGKTSKAILDSNASFQFSAMLGDADISIISKDYVATYFTIKIAQSTLKSANKTNEMFINFDIPMVSLLTENQTIIKGTVTYETDLTNTEPEIVENSVVYIALNTRRLFQSFQPLIETYNCPECSQITGFVYLDVVLRSQTNKDGDYELAVPFNLPEIPIAFTFDELQGFQKLLINKIGDETVYGIQQVRTLWQGACFDQSQTSNIPVVPPAYVVISEPEVIIDTLKNHSETKQAIGLPILENGQIIGVTFEPTDTYPNLTRGSGYVNPPKISFVPAIPGVGANAVAIAKLNTDGSISEVIMINKGEGYVAKNQFAEVYDGTNASDSSPNSPGMIVKLTPEPDSISNCQYSYTLKKNSAANIDVNMGTGYRREYKK